MIGEEGVRGKYSIVVVVVVVVVPSSFFISTHRVTIRKLSSLLFFLISCPRFSLHSHALPILQVVGGCISI